MIRKIFLYITAAVVCITLIPAAFAEGFGEYPGYPSFTFEENQQSSDPTWTNPEDIYPTEDTNTSESYPQTEETTPEPVETTTPEPVETTTPEPVETTTPEPVETTTPEPVETTTPEPVETTTPPPDIAPETDPPQPQTTTPAPAIQTTAEETTDETTETSETTTTTVATTVTTTPPSTSDDQPPITVGTEEFNPTPGDPDDLGSILLILGIAAVAFVLILIAPGIIRKIKNSIIYKYD